MPNKHFCQGPDCHTKTTNDRFLKSRGVIRGKYAYANHRLSVIVVGDMQTPINTFVVNHAS